MANGNIICSKEVSDIYDKLNKKYRYMINMKDEYQDNLVYVASIIRDEFCKTGYSDETIADMLVEYLYGRNKRYKQLLWFCYGQNVVNNLKNNLVGKNELKKTRYIQCIDCGEWIEVDLRNTKTCRCDTCQNAKTRRSKREYYGKNVSKYKI